MLATRFLFFRIGGDESAMGERLPDAVVLVLRRTMIGGASFAWIRVALDGYRWRDGMPTDVVVMDSAGLDGGG